MGLGTSKLQEQLTAAERELSAARTRCQSLEAQNQTLQAEAHRQADQLRQSEETLSDTRQDCARRLGDKDEELRAAVKQRQLTEDLRRSDALLAKRIMCAQLKQAGQVPAAVQDAGSVVAGGALAAQLALAAQDEVQLRQTLVNYGEQLGTATARTQELELAHTVHQRRELCDAIWTPELCDISVALRGAQFMVLGGLRLPRAPQPGHLNGNGLSPGLAVLRHFGDAMRGPWAAAGGSLLLDARVQRLSSLRVAVAAEPRPGLAVSFGFDETGFLSGSLKTAIREALSMRVHAKVDANGKDRPAVGVQFLYDVL